MCVTTAVLIAGGIASTGGLAALAVKKLRLRGSAASEPGDDGHLAVEERDA
ncbi:MAG TPA: hypothetical protein VJZ73_08695 [Methylomirabilota bacterium]|nr:hypothetical protein [Methylomirabilota bacterium]